MRVISYCGLPGTGKTIHTVIDARFHFFKENFSQFLKIHLFKPLPFFKTVGFKAIHQIYLDLIAYKSRFPKGYINNVYSTFPITLNRKHNITTEALHLDDLNCTYSFEPNSMLIIDETQLFYDSDEYTNKIIKKQLSKLGQFFQSHRHFGIHSIILTSQNPNRIVKKLREVSVWFVKHKKVINFPIIPISLLRVTYYEDIDFYGKHIPRDSKKRKELDFEYEIHYRFFLRKIAFSSYKSRYLASYNFSKPLLNRGTWGNLLMSFNNVSQLFDLDKNKLITQEIQLERNLHKDREKIVNIIDNI